MIFTPQLDTRSYTVIVQALDVYVNNYRRIKANEQQARFHEDLESYIKAGESMKRGFEACRDSVAPTYLRLSNAQHILVLRALRMYMNGHGETISQMWKTDRKGTSELRAVAALRQDITEASDIFEMVKNCARQSG